MSTPSPAIEVPRVVPIGLVVGEGTGPELRQAFVGAVEALAAGAPAGVRLIECPHRFRTFSAALDQDLDAAGAIRIEDEDAHEFEAFLRRLHGAGCRALFRTAFNAAALYRVRERLRAVKIERLPHAAGELLLIRDQAQGFYSGTNDAAEEDDRIVRVCEFRRDTTHRVLDFARRTANETWGETVEPARFVVVCKFHLLDNRFARWISEWSRTRDVDASVFQPDTANRHLLAGQWHGRVVVVGSNEWGDIMHADLTARHGLGAHDDRFSRNVYLHADVDGLVEYQTVHGSADDIAGQDRVDPTATLRAAADLVESVVGVTGAIDRMAEALALAEREGRSTRRTVRSVLERLGSAPAVSSRDAPDADG